MKSPPRSIALSCIAASACRPDGKHGQCKNAVGPVGQKFPGLEVLYALLMKGLSERNLPLTQAARLLAHNPARLFRITHAKGALSVGRDADIVLMRRDTYRYRAGESGNNFVSWSPYDGIELPFRVVATFLRGTCVAADGQVIAAPGHGRFVMPSFSSH